MLYLWTKDEGLVSQNFDLKNVLSVWKEKKLQINICIREEWYVSDSPQ